MEEETQINFKTLRAKFQQEALMASRPAVAGKCKAFPPPGGHCSSVLIHMAVEHKTPMVPRVFFRDGLRTSGGKRPISFPPHPQHSPLSQTDDGDVPPRHFFKDRHMPLVLPALPKETAERGFRKELQLEVDDFLQSKTKRKGLLLPFKHRAAKASSDHWEEPTYADLTCRPASAPGELPTLDRQSSDDRVSLQGSEGTSECTFSSPDVTISPPSAETHADSDSRVFSTLERAKKKFSRRHVMSTKPKSSSPDRGLKGKVHSSPTLSSHSSNLPAPPHVPAPPPVHAPPPVPALNLPNFIYISARPFSKGTSTFKSPLEKHFGKDKANRPFARVGEPQPPSPQKKPLPDLWALGPQPKKPPRPPVVDLTSLRPQMSHDKSLPDVSPGLDHSAPQDSDLDHTASASVLDAPEFPDFETLELETAEAVDLVALDLEAVALPVPEDTGPAQFRETHRDHFPEPINWSEFPALAERSQSKETTVDSSVSECRSGAEDTEQGSHISDFEVGIYQQEVHPDTCDNVYEDVENITKCSLQNSHKWKGLKNPYGDNSHVKEESVHYKWQRTSRNVGDSGYLCQSQINSKECQSPNTADFKEQKKREKQRLEREKKEQKEREKKENEMKKKFKVTGEEEPLYHAKVTVASKLRKHDLAVKTGDTVSIIRTTNCPKGKWLARDLNHKYGYISVMNVELNIKEMLELGKKAQAAGRGGSMEPDSISIESSSHPALTSSCEFTDDSEEWACEDETLSPSNESLSFPQPSARLPEPPGGHVGAQHTLSEAGQENLHTQTRHEALQKLAIFFQLDKEVVTENSIDNTMSSETPNLCDVEEPPLPEQEIDFTEMEFLPPPPLYADVF